MRENIQQDKVIQTVYIGLTYVNYVNGYILIL